MIWTMKNGTWMLSIMMLFNFNLSNKKKKKGENHILVPIFLRDFHFGLYLLFSPFLVPI